MPTPASPEMTRPPASSPTHQKTELRYQMALEAAEIGTWSWALGATDISLDPFTHKLFGLNTDAVHIPGPLVEQCIHPADLERIRTEIRRCVETEADLEIEFRVIWPSDQSTHFLRARGKIYRGEEQISAGMTGACWDITERTAMQAELAHERFLLRTLMEHMPDKIYFKDRESRFTRVSNALVQWHSSTDETEILGKTDFDFFSAEHAKQAYEDEQRIIATGKPLVDLEEKETWVNGFETWASTTKLPLVDVDGKIIGTFGISRDITDRRRAESALAKSTDELRRRHAELEEDLAMARELQSALLPKHYPCFPPHAKPEESILGFAHFFNPSMAVSGDFFDVLELSETTAGVLICDVMGHGMRAALVAAIIRALVGELRSRAKVPGDFLTHLNRKLVKLLKATGITLFASAAYAVIDMGKGEVRYANAGHPDPIWIRHHLGKAETLPLNQCPHGPVLGLMEGAHYESACAKLSEHDVILLFTDGLFEVEDSAGELYDQERLYRAVHRRAALPAAEICQEVLDEIQQFSAEKHFTDDVCLLAVEVNPTLRRCAVPPKLARPT